MQSAALRRSGSFRASRYSEPCAPGQVGAALEPTGVYHEAAALALHEAEVHVFVVNPAQLRDFAKGHAVRTKTDGKDSLILALCVAQVKLIAWH
jgi:transposase